MLTAYACLCGLLMEGKVNVPFLVKLIVSGLTTILDSMKLLCWGHDH